MNACMLEQCTICLMHYLSSRSTVWYVQSTMGAPILRRVLAVLTSWLTGLVCTSRMAQYIGQKSVAKCKGVFKLTLFIQLVYGLLTAGFFTSLRYQLAEIFTDNKEILDLASSLTLTSIVALSNCGTALILRLI